MAPIKNNILQYFHYDEVVIHNKRDDFWVVVHRDVFDLTPLLNDRRDHWNQNMQYLLSFGGKDLSHLFHENHLPKTETSPASGAPRVLFPPILEVAISDRCKTRGKLWSQDKFYHIGRLTCRERSVRIINTLTTTTTCMKVCDEDTIYDIQRKYKEKYNSHAGSYLWRKFSHGGNCPGDLNLNGTLDDNGLTEIESDVPMPTPSLWLYYTDDMTIA